jgi:hypothetical protein
VHMYCRCGWGMEFGQVVVGEVTTYYTAQNDVQLDKVFFATNSLSKLLTASINQVT